MDAVRSSRAPNDLPSCLTAAPRVPSSVPVDVVAALCQILKYGSANILFLAMTICVPLVSAIVNDVFDGRPEDVSFSTMRRPAQEITCTTLSRNIGNFLIEY